MPVFFNHPVKWAIIYAHFLSWSSALNPISLSLLPRCQVSFTHALLSSWTTWCSCKTGFLMPVFDYWIHYMWNTPRPIKICQWVRFADRNSHIITMCKNWVEKHLYVIWVNTGILKAATMSTIEMTWFCEMMSFSYGSTVLFSKMQWLWNELFISKIIFRLSTVISRSHLEIVSCHCFGGRISWSPWELYAFLKVLS